MSGTAPKGYDPIELQRRIAVCCSIPELQKLAGELGLGGIAWDRGGASAARELVQQAERYCGLTIFVNKLREAKPLVEWPEPEADPPEPLPAPAGAPPMAGAPPSAPAGAGMAFVAQPSLGAQPGTLGAPAFAPAPVSAPVPAPASVPASAPVPAPASVPASAPASAPTLPGAPLFAPPPSAPAVAHAPPPLRPSPVWPGTIPDPMSSGAAPSRGIDPRVLVLVAGLTVLAALIAYIAGRASNNGPSPAASTSAPLAPSAAPPLPPDKLAARAADAIARSLVNVARACELPGAASQSPEILRRAYERCGRSAWAPNPGAVPARAPDPDSASTASRDPDDPGSSRPNRDPLRDPPRPAKPAKPGNAGAQDTPAPPPAPGKGCLNKCESEHQGCKSHCGPEPSESSRYEAYNVCLSRCLSSASRCRLGCQ